MFRRTVPVLLAVALALGAGCGINRTADAGDAPEVGGLGEVEGEAPAPVDGDLAAYCQLVTEEELAASMTEYLDYYERVLAVAPDELKDEYEVIIAKYEAFLDGSGDSPGASTDDLEAATQTVVEFNLMNC